MSRGDPAVSVVMTVHDGERFLPPAVESVLGQTLEDFELLIVDDGSTDRTPEMTAEYADKDSRIAVHRVDRIGRPAALNFACAHARAELIAVLDADDVALPQRLERQLRFLSENPDVALLGGGVRLINEHGTAFGEDRQATDDAQLRKTLEKQCPFYHSTVVYRKRAAEEVGGYREAYVRGQDYDLWLRLAEAEGNRIASLDELVGEYRMYARPDPIRRMEAEAVAVVAAFTAAKDRREGRADRLAGATHFDADVLLAAGVEPQVLAKVMSDVFGWWAESLALGAEASAA